MAQQVERQLLDIDPKTVEAGIVLGLGMPQQRPIARGRDGAPYTIVCFASKFMSLSEDRFGAGMKNGFGIEGGIIRLGKNVEDVEKALRDYKEGVIERLARHFSNRLTVGLAAECDESGKVKYPSSDLGIWVRAESPFLPFSVSRVVDGELAAFT